MLDRRPALATEHQPVSRGSGSHDQYADENPPLSAIALEDRRRPMKEAEDQEQAHYQTKPVGSPVNPG